MESTRRKYLVLSFDGGGVRMVLQNRILDRIIEKYPNLLDKITVFAGTSAGSILAVGLATGVSPSNFLSKTTIKTIFKKTSLGIFKNKYDNKGLLQSLRSAFGNQTFPSHVSEKKLFVTAFKACVDEVLKVTSPETPKWYNPRVPRWHPLLFNNFSSTPNESLVNIIASSCSAPTYFPIYNGLVDGGIGNTNPSLSVLSKMVAEGIDISDIYILSIGSGENSNSIPVKDKNAKYGALRWAPHILDMLFDATSELVSQQLYEILGDRFWRVQPVLGSTSIPLNDIKSYDKLLDLADTFNLENTLRWIGNVLNNKL